MESCKNFSKKYPILLVILTLALVYGLLHLTALLPSGPMQLAAIEWTMAVCLFVVTYLFMGKEKVSFSKKGFGYSFRSLRGYFIFMILFNAFAILGAITLNMQKGGEFHYQPIAFINVFAASIAIGIVEEFSFRGLIFGGLLQKLGNSKKNIILAAFLSGLLFGVMHVFESVITGGVTNMASAATAVLKTVQTGVFGIALAFIYYKTRNIFAVAALHALDDFLLLFAGTFLGGERVSYVTSSNASSAIVAYIVFTLIVVPSIVRCIKNVTPEEAIPFDEDFLPREVEFEKKSKRENNMSGFKEFKITTNHFTTNCIQFGSGSKTLIMIAGLNVVDAKGKRAALGVAYAYRCFAKDYTVYIFDRREDLPEHFSTEEIAEDIADCMKELKLDHADVFGVSQGGMIAQYLALNHPELVDKMVLGVTASRTNETMKATIGRWYEMAKAGNIRGVIEDYFYNTYSDAYLKKYKFMIPLLVRTMKPMEDSRFLTLTEACFSCNTYDRLKEIQCPVLVLGGGKDKVVSKEASLEIAEKLGCKPIIYEEYGHSAYEEAKDFNKRVLEFLQNS